MFQEGGLKEELGGEGGGHTGCDTVGTISVCGAWCQEQKHRSFGLFTHVLLMGAPGRESSFDRKRLKMDSSYFAQRKLLIRKTANKVTTSED